MRIVLALHNYFNDPASAAMGNLRGLLDALANAGHHVQVLCTARGESGSGVDPEAHLKASGITVERVHASKNYTVQGGKVRKVHAGLPILGYDMGKVRVALALTHHHDLAKPDARECTYYLGLLDALITGLGNADALLACGSHTVLFDALKLARGKGLISVFSLQDRSCEDRRWFQHVNHAFTFDAALADHYRGTSGVIATALPVPGHDESNRRCVEYFASLKPGASAFAPLK